MQAKGSEGELLKKSIQDILENIPEEQIVSIVTPTESFWDVNPKSIFKELQNLKYTFYAFQPDYLLSQIENKKPNTAKDYIFITDGVQVISKKVPELSQKSTLYGIFPKTESTANCSIDNITVSNTSDRITSYNVCYTKLLRILWIKLFFSGEPIIRTFNFLGLSKLK